MTEMIERVARAIAIRHGSDPDQEGPGLRHVIDIDGVSTIITDHVGALWRMWIPDARAAIAAMREPTEAQYEALSATNLTWRELTSLKVWQTYIDAALGDQPR